MNVSIIIVNWNSKDFTKNCIRSIPPPPPDTKLQIIVVDGGSFDGCSEMISNNFPKVQFIQSPNNIGFAKCNNLGARFATGEFIFFLNPDTILYPNFFPAILSAIQKHPSFGIFGAKLLNPDKSFQKGSIHTLPKPVSSAFQSTFLYNYFNLEIKNDTRPLRVQAVGGAFMAIRREIFKQVGGFSPFYFMYAEDMDLCYKVSKLNLPIFHVPQATMIHFGGESSSQLKSTFSNLMTKEALCIYFSKNHSFLHAEIFKVSTLISSLLKYIIVLSHQTIIKSLPTTRYTYSKNNALAGLEWYLNAKSTQKVFTRYGNDLLRTPQPIII
jgi:GT2 family glycosyltransferase